MSGQNSERKHAWPTESPNDVKQVAEAPRKKRRLAGKLTSIMNMPVDVFCEIASHLSPEDVLRMARAFRALRTLLMSKSSKFIWNAAEKSVGIPACPSDLSSPQYASLIFDTFCMICLASRARHVMVHTRSRLCKACQENELVDGEELLPEGMAIGELSALMPGSSLAQLANSKDWFAERSLTHSVHESQFGDNQFYFRPLVLRACEEYEKLVTSGEDKREFLNLHSQKLFEMQKHNTAIMRWTVSRRNVRSEALAIEKGKRREQIHRRLRELGYTDEDFLTNHDERGWKWKTLIDQPREMAEKSWTTILPQLENTISLRKKKGRQMARAACLAQRDQHLKKIAKSLLMTYCGKFCLLPFETLLRLPDVDKIINADGPETWISRDNQQVILPIMIDAGLDMMGQAIERCISKTLDALVECGLLPRSYAERMEQSVLPSAFPVYNVTDQRYLFLLVENDKPKSSESVMAGTPKIHPHAGQLNYVVNLNYAFFKNCWEDDRPMSIMDILNADWLSSKESYIYSGRPEWPHTFRYEIDKPDRQAIMIAAMLSEALGIKNMSMSQLEARGRVFLCLRCDPVFRRVMDWKEIVRHFCMAEQEDTKIRSFLQENEMYRSLFVFDHALQAYSPLQTAMFPTNGTTDMGNLSQCSCRRCSQTPRVKGIKCKICALADVKTTAPCVSTLRIHLQRRHDCSDTKEVAVALGLKSLW